MKNYVIAIMFGLLISISACEEQEPESIKVPMDIEVINQNINELSLMIAKATGTNPELRKMLKEEIGYRFDFDNDALLVSLIGKEINGSTFESILADNSDGKHTAVNIEEIINESGYLQISLPVNFDTFNPDIDEPLVVAVPVNLDEKSIEEFVAYDKNGVSTKISAKVRPTMPVFVINKSERVDNNGKVIVGQSGFLVPEESRIHYKEAIKQAHLNFTLKNNPNKFSLIEVQSDADYLKTIACHGSSLNESPLLSQEVTDKSTLAVTQNFFAEPLAYNSVDLNWNTYPNANRFLIYRTGFVKVNGLRTWQPDKLIYTLTNTYSKSDMVDYCNDEYKYYLKYYNGNTFLAQSNSVSIHSSHRKNNGMEYLSRVIASESMVTQLEGWWVSELEIRVQIVYKNYTGIVAQVPDIGFPIPTDGKGRLRDVNWTGQMNLFGWDRKGYDFGAYTLVMEEVDNDENHNDKTKIWLSWVRFVAEGTQFEEVADMLIYSVNILDEPDYIGSKEIKWWDPDGSLWQINPKGFTIMINHSTTI